MPQQHNRPTPPHISASLGVCHTPQTRYKYPAVMPGRSSKPATPLRAAAALPTDPPPAHAASTAPEDAQSRFKVCKGDTINPMVLR